MNDRIPGGEGQFHGPRRLDGPSRRTMAARRMPSIQPNPAITTATPTQPASVAPRVVKSRHGVKRQHHWVRWTALAVLAVVLMTGSFLGYRVIMAANHVITKPGKGSPALDGTISTATLKGEGSGRVNILLLGIGGGSHSGPNLSDTMMVMSIDPKTKDVAMLSIPRDLYVKIPGYGYGKINSANADGGPALAEQVVSTILDLPIDYYVQVDFSGFKQAVNAVGGVNINVPTALYDHQYPCDVGNGICPYYQAAGETHMNGELALEYSRCRHDQPVGDCGDDTGRAARQQQILTALRQKALSAGTLTNPLKLADLINAIGSHVKTDLQLKDIEKLAVIAKDVNPSKIVSKVPQFQGPDAILTTENNAAGSVLVPKAGEFDYSALQDLAHSIFVDHYITSENALIQVQNGSGVAGLAGQVVSTMQAYHYNVMSAATAAEPYAKTVIYDYTNGKKPYTINYLEQRFGVKAQKGPPGVAITQATTNDATTSGSGTSTASSTQTPQIIIILGSDYASSLTASTLSSTP